MASFFDRLVLQANGEFLGSQVQESIPLKKRLLLAESGHMIDSKDRSHFAVVAHKV